ncbi:MAG: Ca-activated chloride channel family protein, partial [Bacteroidia bacterium]
EPELEPEFSSSRYKPNNVLLLLDVSGSMKDEDKMVKLKASIRRLVMMLREVDVLTMIAYNSTSWELLPPTPVVDNQAIIALIDSLQPYGYTNGVKGMESAYASLQSQLISGGNNQLIIATDGKFNSSKFSEKDAIELVKSNSDKGIVLSIIGFGEDKEAGRLMKKLAGLGEGSFLQVKNNEDPTEVLAEEIKSRSRKL